MNIDNWKLSLNGFCQPNNNITKYINNFVQRVKLDGPCIGLEGETSRYLRNNNNYKCYTRFKSILEDNETNIPKKTLLLNNDTKFGTEKILVINTMDELIDQIFDCKFIQIIYIGCKKNDTNITLLKQKYFVQEEHVLFNSYLFDMRLIK